MMAKRSTIGLYRLQRTIGAIRFMVPILLMVLFGYLFRNIGNPESWRNDRLVLLKSLQTMTDEYFLRHQRELDILLTSYSPDPFAIVSMEQLFASLSNFSGDWQSLEFRDESGGGFKKISGNTDPEEAISSVFVRQVSGGTLIAGAVPRSLEAAAGSAAALIGGEVLIIDENGGIAVRLAAEPLLSGSFDVSDFSGSEETWLVLKTGKERIIARTLIAQSGWRVIYIGLVRDMNLFVLTFWFVAAFVLVSMGIILPAVHAVEHRYLNRPLKTMASWTQGFSIGTRVLVREHFRIREVDSLGNSICEMMETITERENALRLMNETLETQVEERTRAYQETIETLRSTRDQLLLSEKMAALGSLVSGIAHEINTPMSIGITAASYMNERTRNIVAEWDAQTLTREALEQYLRDTGESSGIVQTNLEQASRIINSLKRVAADQQLDEHREFELSSYIRDIILSLKHQLRPGRHQIFFESGSLIMVDTYPGVITQVVNNLIFNSITHGFEDREGGQIRIVTRAEGDEVIMEYRDNGRGLEDEEFEHIFEPFYTTSLKEGGTGLGMNIVRNLVRDKLKGRIDITVPEGGGAGFTVRFPKAAEGDL